MVQHILLLDIAPILLILGLTKVLLRPGHPSRADDRAPRRLPRPSGVRGDRLRRLHVAVAHPRDVRPRAAATRVVHALEHLCFAAAGGLYWWHRALADPQPRRGSAGMGPVGYMTSTKLLVGLLGVVLAFAPSVLYPFYAHQPHYWGLSPTEDQNTGRPGDGARAVDRDGDRARLPVRADARPSPSARRSGRSASRSPEGADRRRRRAGSARRRNWSTGQTVSTSERAGDRRGLDFGRAAVVAVNVDRPRALAVLGSRSTRSLHGLAR